MKDTAYGSSNVLIRVYENNLLNRGHYDRMLAADSFEDAVNVLRETPYRNDVDRIKEDKNYDTMLMNELHQTFDELFNISPNKALIELFGLRYAYHNLKVLFKEEFTDQDMDHLFIPIGRYDIADLRQAVRTGASDVLSEPYLDSIHEVQEDYDQYHNPQAVDIILDRRFFTHMRILADETGEQGIPEMVETFIDYQNLSTLTRAMRQNRTRNFLKTILSSSGSIPKEELVEIANKDMSTAANILGNTKYKSIIEASIDPETNELSPVRLDFATDNAYMEMMRNAKLAAFGPLPIVAFIYAKETEVKNLRLILSGKENGVSADGIRERMRLNYA